MIGRSGIEAAPLPGESGQDQKVEQGAGDEASEDDEGHGAFDLAAGFATAEGEGQDAKGGDESGHEDGEQAFAGPAGDGVESPGGVFLRDEVLIVGDEHDAVPGADAKEGDEADQGTDAENTAAGEDSEDATDEGEGKIGENEEDMIGPGEDEAEEHQNEDEGP
jgi:hypothetical protein